MFFKKDKVEGNDYHNLDLDNIPKHIAFIMDGNGRWAKNEKCHVLMVIMKEPRQFVILL